MTMHQSRAAVTTEAIRAALHDRAEALFCEAFGEPTRASGREWRAKDDSARKMTMTGPHRGSWRDFRTEEWGDLFDLIAVYHLGLTKAADDFARVKAEAARYCGILLDAPIDRRDLDRRQEEREQAAEVQAEAEAHARADTLQRLRSAAQRIEGTPGAEYLRGRAITALPPSGLAFMPPLPPTKGIMHGDHPALTVWAVDDAGAIHGGQRILVTPDGGKANVNPRKPSFGAIQGHPARFPARIEGGPLCIAESPEAALSVWQATGFETWAVFGVNGFYHAPIPIGRKAILCPDRDEPIGTHPAGSPEAMRHEAAARAFRKAALHHRSMGRDLWIALAPEEAGSKADLNDTHQRAGAEAVRQAIADAIQVGPEPTPPGASLGGTVEEARGRVRDQFDQWQAATVAQDGTAPVWGVRVTTGVGKSYQARQHALRTIEEMRGGGDMRSIVIAVPRHDLGSEYLSEMMGQGFDVEIYRGETQPDPEAPGERMCRRADEAREVRKAGADLDRTLCKQGEFVCPFYATCGRQRQKKMRADIWLVPHNLIWSAPPPCLGEIAGLVVDEDPQGGLFGGFEKEPYRLSLDDLTAPAPRLSVAGNADMTAATSGLARAARESATGRVYVADLGLTRGDIGAAIKAAGDAITAPDCGPTDEPDEVAAALACVAPTNRRMLRIINILKAVRSAVENGASIVPGLTVDNARSGEGEGFKAIRLRWRETIGNGWQVPTICLSATARRDILAHIWPAIGRIAEATADASFVTVRQITDRTFGKTSLASAKDAEPNPHAAQLLSRLRRYIEARMTEVPGPCLVIAQKSVVEALGNLPDGAEAIHFNALSGIDRFKTVRTIIQIGRPSPSTADVELRAELLTGGAIESVGGRFLKAPARLTMRDGTAGPEVFTRAGKGGDLTFGTDRHPNKVAEAIRWLICEAEMIQAAGRGRGVNRTADTPLQIDILANLPLPIPVDEAGTFDSFEPHPADVMAARRLLIEDTGAKGAWDVVAAILSDTFRSKEAARDFFKARRSRGENHISIPIGISPREGIWAKIRVKSAGGRYAVDALVKAETETEARAILARYGLELVAFEGAKPAPAPARPADPETPEVKASAAPPGEAAEEKPSPFANVTRLPDRRRARAARQADVERPAIPPPMTAG